MFKFMVLQSLVLVSVMGISVGSYAQGAGGSGRGGGEISDGVLLDIADFKDLELIPVSNIVAWSEEARKPFMQFEVLDQELISWANFKNFSFTELPFGEKACPAAQSIHRVTTELVACQDQFDVVINKKKFLALSSQQKSFLILHELFMASALDRGLDLSRVPQLLRLFARNSVTESQLRQRIHQTEFGYYFLKSESEELKSAYQNAKQRVCGLALADRQIQADYLGLTDRPFDRSDELNDFFLGLVYQKALYSSAKAPLYECEQTMDMKLRVSIISLSTKLQTTP